MEVVTKKIKRGSEHSRNLEGGGYFRLGAKGGLSEEGTSLQHHPWEQVQLHRLQGPVQNGRVRYLRSKMKNFKMPTAEL